MTPSEHLLRRLAQTNPTAVFLAALAALLLGLFLPGVIGAALLFVLGAGLAALTVTTWPVQRPATRVMRVALLGLLFATVIAKVL